MANVETVLRDNLLRLATAFARAKGWGLTTVSSAIHGDTPFFHELLRQQSGGAVRGRKGSFTVRKYVEMVSAFAERWPSDAGWPHLAGIAPVASPAQALLASDTPKKKTRARKRGPRARK